MPGLAELREWLRTESESWRSEADRHFESSKLYQEGYASGFASGLEEVQRRLEALDSSPDLPSTKG